MQDGRIQSFQEFWPFYLGEHSKAGTRWLHFVGSTLGLGWLAWALIDRNPLWILAALGTGYAFAWVSHFGIEKNRPATFTYPLWSFAADWKMWFFMLTGRIRGEIERHVPAASRERVA